MAAEAPSVREESSTRRATARPTVRPRAPAAPAPRRAPLRRLLRVVGTAGLALLLAFGGGMAATFLYDRLVPLPRPALGPEDTEAFGAPDLFVGPPLPTPELRRRQAVDRAVDALRAGLPPAARVEIDSAVQGEAVILTGVVDTSETLEDVAAAAGAVDGVVAVDTRQVKIESRLHLVEPGQTLGDVALQYYGRRDAWRVIAGANPGIDPHRLRPGDPLRVPSPPRDGAVPLPAAVR